MPSSPKLSRGIFVACLIGAALGVGAPASEAAFPGAKGRIAYVSSQGDLYTARYNGTDSTLLATGVSGPRTTGPRWSPDGTKIVFSRNPGIWMINADGTNQHQIRATGLYPAWSPDGTKIVFAERVTVPGGPADRLHVMNVDGTGAVQLPTQPASEFGGNLIAPTWSPDGQLIAYVENAGEGNGLFVVNADGTGRQTVFPNDGCGCLVGPEWLPDGSRIAYTRFFLSDSDLHVLTVRPDGTGEVDLGGGGALVWPIAWSPDGTAFGYGHRARTTDGSVLGSFGTGTIHSWQPIPSSEANLAIRKTDSPDPAYRGETLEYSISVRHVSGTQIANAAVVNDTLPSTLGPQSATATQGTCSITGQDVSCSLGNIAPDEAVTVTIRAEVLQAGDVTNTATVSSSGSDPDLLNNSDTEQTTVPIATGYPRPGGAPSITVPLVPAYTQCTGGNRSHGPPLAYASCNPPAQASSYLTVGTAEANQLPTRSIASERVKVLVGNPQTGADEADVQFSFSATDVRRKSNFGDYTGQLQVAHTLRITDRLNDDAGVPATMRDYVFKFTVPCTATGSAAVGATCAVTTTADTVIPGAVPEGKRGVWELDQVRVFDGGSDGVASTDDNTVFAKQGLFVP